MIYTIENGQKVPLGTQFDNSWQIEYDRDLSSQLSGKSEWTATEDCWFQFHSIWIRQGDSYTNDNAYLSGVQITLNDVNVANMDKSNITNGTTGAVYMITSQLLMKKGDTVKFYSTASTGSQPAFNTTTTHVFPIHRILSKDEGPIIADLTVYSAQASNSLRYAVTLYPIGDDTYIFAAPVMKPLYPKAATMYISYLFSEDFDILDVKADYWQVAEGTPISVGYYPDNRSYVYTNCVNLRNGSDSTHSIEIRGQGIVRRKS